MKAKTIVGAGLLLLAGCATRPPELPYPAFIATDELPDAFVAGLPGVRAKQMATDPRTQRGSYRITVPPDWSFTTGSTPGHSIEIFMLAGLLQIGEFSLSAGGYAFVPAGHPGLPMKSDNGALFLYFVDEANASSVIGTPLISNADLVAWQALDVGVDIKELRRDPGSGARTWLMRMTADAMLGWQQSSQPVEGYLVSGSISYSECHAGGPVTGDYLPGGYFLRPPGAAHGGPDVRTVGGATWLMRVLAEDRVELVQDCNLSASTTP